MKIRMSLTPFIAALLVGLALLAATLLPKPVGNSPSSAEIAAIPEQPQIVIAKLQSDPGTLFGPFSGQVKVDWTVIGVYSTTLATPTRQPTLTPAPADLGAIDFGLQLTQTGNQISGFVDLGETLVYTTEATIMATPVQPTPLPGTPTPVAAPLGIGPIVTGRLNGANLQLQSTKVRGILAGVPVQRQFRLTGVVTWVDGLASISGEYRETIWGYVPQPLTVLGHFTLRQPLYDMDTPTAVPTNTRTPVAGATNTPTKVTTNTPTAVATNTPTKVATSTPTAVATNTRTPVTGATSTPTAVATNTPTPTASAFDQWASTATASTEYTNTDWGSNQATGAPNVEACGDNALAWAPAPGGADAEWLRLGYATPVYAVGVRVHETYVTGSIVGIDLVEPNGTVHALSIPADTTPCVGYFEVFFARTSYLVSTVLIHTQINDWEEIDAVELRGMTTLAATSTPTRTPTTGPTATPTPSRTPTVTSPTGFKTFLPLSLRLH